MLPFSLLSPLPGLPCYLMPLWPLIYFRIKRLKAWFRANGGPDSQMFWGLTKTGRVILIRASDDLTGRGPCTFRAPVSDWLEKALSGEYLSSTACPPRTPGPQAIARGLAARDPGLRRDYGPMGPIPDT